MKRLFLAAIAVMMTAFSVNAQVKIESPHPDLSIKVTRCAYASGTVVIDMVITNFGQDETIAFYGSNNGNVIYAATAYDDDGNQYTSKNSSISVGLLSIGHSSSNNEIIFPQDIPMKFRAEIQKIKPNATKLMLLKLPVFSRGAMALKIEKPLIIRNLEWAK